MCYYKFEKASEQHMNFILKSILDASKDEHFNPIYYKLNNIYLKGLELQIKSTLKDGKMPISEYDSVSSNIYIYSKNKKPYAMSWIKENEIYLFYVDKEERNKGIGKRFLIKLIKELFLEKEYIFVRIYKEKSSIFEQLVIKQGFKEDYNTNKYTKKYQLSKKDNNLISPIYNILNLFSRKNKND